jgi:hypothetical protein
MAENVQFVDPTRKEIQFANGPCSVTRAADTTIITFTQISPRIDGTGAGKSQTQSDAVVLCRIALPQQVVAELVRIIAEVYKADTPAGSESRQNLKRPASDGSTYGPRASRYQTS